MKYICKRTKNTTYDCEFQSINLKGKSKRGFFTIKEALIYRDGVLKIYDEQQDKEERKRIDEILKTPIIRDENGIAIMKTYF